MPKNDATLACRYEACEGPTCGPHDCPTPVVATLGPGGHEVGMLEHAIRRVTFRGILFASIIPLFLRLDTVWVAQPRGPISTRKFHPDIRPAPLQHSSVFQIAYIRNGRR